MVSTRYRPGAGETICPPPVDGSSRAAYRFAANQAGHQYLHVAYVKIAATGNFNFVENVKIGWQK